MKQRKLGWVVLMAVALMPHVQADGPLPADAPVSLEAHGELSSVRLTWSPPADNGGSEVSEYRVYQTDEHGERRLVGTSEDTEFRHLFVFGHEDVLEPREIHFEVTAVNAAGEGPPSAPVAVGVPCEPIVVYYGFPPKVQVRPACVYVPTSAEPTI